MLNSPYVTCSLSPPPEGSNKQRHHTVVFVTWNRFLCMFDRWVCPLRRDLCNLVHATLIKEQSRSDHACTVHVLYIVTYVLVLYFITYNTEYLLYEYTYQQKLSAVHTCYVGSFIHRSFLVFGPKSWSTMGYVTTGLRNATSMRSARIDSASLHSSLLNLSTLIGV